MAVLFTPGMASSVMRGVCRKEEAAAAEEAKALLGDSKCGATKNCDPSQVTTTHLGGRTRSPAAINSSLNLYNALTDLCAA